MTVHGEHIERWHRQDTILLVLLIALICLVLVSCVHGDPAAPQPCFRVFTHWNYIGDPPTAMRLVQDSIVACR